MEQQLVTLLFFTGMIPHLLVVSFKYKLIQQGKKWSDAQTYCRIHYRADLVVFHSSGDMVQLQDEMHKQQITSSAWIGLYGKIISWYWSMGNEPLGSMTDWGSSQPNNGAGNEWCGVTSPTGWLDRPCSSLYPSLCFDESKIGVQRYVYISNRMSWYEAQVYCRNHYTDLASARDATENSVLAGLTSGWTWFGLSRDSWKWINQSPISTITWMYGEPNIVQFEQTCGYISNGKAGDALCSDIMPFVCYSEIMGKQHIMRMEVRSDKDVNDPAVMDAIMKQIEQKLEERGLAGIVMVKWSVQQDGKVFHKNKEKKATEKHEV